MPQQITMIPADKAKHPERALESEKKRKVAGYARVSTDHEEQLSSYEAQMDYYRNYIAKHEDWEFAGMYSDEGKSATSTKKRDGFNAMVSDALEGRIDLIITKSVSRFARNTVDSLSAIRRLKAKGVEVYFEKENIWTLDAKGELLITIMSSLSQEESRSISENTVWGQRKRFADGKWSVAYSRFLGYDKGTDGKVVVNPGEAEVVRDIYTLFLKGLSYSEIAKRLMEKGARAPAGGKTWYAKTVMGILKNEKYAGKALLQKTYTSDFLTKKRKVNTGEVPQYYIEEDHEPIIDPETHRLAQAEIIRRAGKRKSGGTIFSGKLVCGECGGTFGPKTWHSNDKYRKIVWRCNRKYGECGKRTNCHSPYLSEKEIKEFFVRALSKLEQEREKHLAHIDQQIKELSDDTAGLEKRLRDAADKMERISAKIQGMTGDEAAKQIDFDAAYRNMEKEFEDAKTLYDSISQTLSSRSAEKILLEAFRKDLRGLKAAGEFSETLWGSMVEKVIVYSRTKVVFEMKGGILERCIRPKEMLI
ncbi:MAG: recombinase family protein [Lachnospiraceae bacterium]|nr:recombinase family protein [Lachnospiraceae bacterium]